MRDGSSILLQDPDGAQFGTKAVKFSPDGKHVVASDYGGMLRLWNVRTSKLVRKWKAHK
jgi:WD40 repeat protein